MDLTPPINPDAEDLRELSLEAILARPCPKPTFPEQNADGVDLSLIREMLRMSPEERVGLIEQHADEVQEMNRVKEHINRPKDQESLFQLRAIKQVRAEQGG